MKHSDFVFPIPVFMESTTLDKAVYTSKGDLFRITGTRKFTLTLQYENILGFLIIIQQKYVKGKNLQI